MLSAENEQYREEPGSIKHLIKLPSFFPICSTHYGMTSTEDDDELGISSYVFLLVLLHLLLLLLLQQQQQQQKLF
jgi:hypothetical protein